MHNMTPHQYPTMTEANPFMSQDEDDDEQDDARSDVSSLSNDSRRRMSPGWDSEETEPKGPPPLEIDISVLVSTKVPDWLQETYNSYSSPPPPPAPDLSPISTGGKSPGVFRPTMGRSRPSPMVFSTSESTLKVPRPAPMLRVLSTSSKIHGSSVTAGSTITGGSVLSSEDLSFLGNRPRRSHLRSPSAALSVGSIVGQSSFVSIVGQSSFGTAPTVTPTAVSSSFSDQSWQHQLNAQRAMDHLVADITPASSNKRNPVKKEIKYVWDRVSTPIRRLTGTDGRKIELKRASGCLT
jgi:hypothetical protein